MLHREIYFYIDESYKANNFIGVAIVAIVGKNNLKIVKDSLDNTSNNPIFRHRNAGSNEIHYVDNNLGPRANVVDKIYSMPISAYMIYDQKDVSKLGKNDKDIFAYEKLLPILLRKVALKYKNTFKDRKITINLFFEQLSTKTNVDKRFFEKCIENTAFDFNVQVIGKKDVFTSLPDYFLGVLGNFVSNSTSNSSKIDLELIEDKIGLIIDNTNLVKEHYGRGSIGDYIAKHSNQ
jgi:hypothetical protein